MKEYQKVLVEVPGPLMLKALEKVVRELPGNAAAVATFNKFAWGYPLPGR